MIRLNWIVLIVITAVVLPAAIYAQEAPTPDAVTQAVEKIASGDKAARQEGFQALLDMGKQGVQALLAMLVEPGKGKDAGARIALHGMAVYVVRPGGPEAERRMFAEVLVNYLAGEAPAATKRFAIRQLHIAGRAESALPLAKCLLDEELASDAIQALVVNPSPEAARALRQALPKTQKATRVGVIQALGQRRDTGAVELLISEAKSGSSEARIAALEALGRIGDPRAESVFSAALTSKQEREQRAAFDAYLLLGEHLLETGKRSQACDVYRRALEAAVTPAQKAAALIGLGQAGSTEDLKALIPYLIDLDPKVRAAAESAIAQLDTAKATVALAEATRSADPDLKIALLRTLAGRPEPAARRAIEAASRDTNAQVRVVALDLLDRLSDPAVLSTLLEAIKSGPGPAYATAMKAYLQQARTQLEKGLRDSARSMFSTALQLARTDDLRRMALDGLAAVASPESLARIEPYLEEEGVRETALRAYVAIASALADSGHKERATQMLQKALELGPPRDVTSRIVAKLRDLGINVDPAKTAGFVSTWWVIGPFPGDRIDREFAPEEAVELAATIEIEGRHLTWIRHHTDDPLGIVNLAAMMKPNTNSTAYLYTEITVEQPQDVLFKVGSDDGMKCWLNGKLIHRYPEPRSLRVDQDTIETHLEAGPNRILLKVVQGGGGWECCLRITDREGKPLKFDQRED